MAGRCRESFLGAESEEMKAEADGREGWTSVMMEGKVLGGT
jgi:hypothetical protein